MPIFDPDLPEGDDEGLETERSASSSSYVHDPSTCPACLYGTDFMYGYVDRHGRLTRSGELRMFGGTEESTAAGSSSSATRSKARGRVGDSKAPMFESQLLHPTESLDPEASR